MLNLITASAYFLLIHFGVSGTRLRDGLVTRLGAGKYRGAFALASVVGLVWMSYAYRSAPTVELWGLVLGFRPAAYVLVVIAFLVVVIGFMTPSPTQFTSLSTVISPPSSSSVRCSCLPWAARLPSTRSVGATSASNGLSLRTSRRISRLPP